MSAQNCQNTHCFKYSLISPIAEPAGACERGVSGGHDSPQINVEYGANPDKQSFSCRCYLSDDICCVLGV